MGGVIRLLSLTTSIIIKLKRRHVNYRSDCFLRGMGNEVSSVIGRVMDRILSARRLFVDKSRMDIVLEQNLSIRRRRTKFHFFRPIINERNIECK